MAEEAKKSEGNAAYQKGDFNAAEKAYTEAIALAPQKAVLYSNRSASRLGLKQLDAALDDADTCIRLDSGWAKGHYRRGQALEALQRRQEALSAYKQALEIDPMNEECVKVASNLRRQLKAEGLLENEKPKKNNGPELAQAYAGPHMQAQGLSAGPPSPSAWAKGLSEKQQYDWLCDCYCMRVDDDMVHGGELRGLYDMDKRGPEMRDGIVADFLIFCKLAVRHKVIPARWSWPAFLQEAKGHLPFAFEKSDAQEKWGGENIFSAMMGGRSLRFTAESVYGTSCMNPDDSKPDLEEVQDQVSMGASNLLQSNPQYFDDVGGSQIWSDLLRTLKVSR